MGLAFDGGEWTLAAYRIRKTGLLSRDPLVPDHRVQVGAQTSRGIEASLNWNFAPRWSLDANATVLKAEFEDFLETTGSPAVLVSRDGNVPPNVAERLASVAGLAVRTGLERGGWRSLRRQALRR